MSDTSPSIDLWSGIDAETGEPVGPVRRISIDKLREEFSASLELQRAAHLAEVVAFWDRRREQQELSFLVMERQLEGALSH